MIPQKIKDQIIKRITSTEAVHSLNDPVIFMDKSGDPWVVESAYAHYMKFKETVDVWVPPNEFPDSLDSNTSVLSGIDGVDQHVAISFDNDPEFIEQVRMAFQMRQL